MEALVRTPEATVAPLLDVRGLTTEFRSREGAWGVISRGLLTRAMSFETALIAAFAPFYNARLYE